jgi:hypothetical protein
MSESIEDNNFSFESDLSVPLCGMELAPFSRERIGCQGFIGPLPSAFLDKCVKELLQSKVDLFQFKKYFFEKHERPFAFFLLCQR